MNLLEWDLIKQGYVKNGDMYRLGAAAHNEVLVRFYPSGSICYRSYTSIFVSSRDPKDGPAYESYYVDGTLSSRQFLFHGRYSRDPKDGPAIESFDSNGSLVRREYYLNGRFLSQQELKTYGVAEKILISL